MVYLSLTCSHQLIINVTTSFMSWVIADTHTSSCIIQTCTIHSQYGTSNCLIQQADSLTAFISVSICFASNVMNTFTISFSYTKLYMFNVVVKSLSSRYNHHESIGSLCCYCYVFQHGPKTYIEQVYIYLPVS